MFVALHQSVGAVQLCVCNNRFGSSIKTARKSPSRFLSKGFTPNNGLFRDENRSFKPFTLSVVRTPHFCASSTDQSTTSVLCSTSDYSQKISDEAALILIRHGQSSWNEKNLFTGCVDVALTGKGVEEAIEAGKRISNIPIDIIYTSALIRAQTTAMLAMTQHRQKKVPIVIHNESEQAKAWTQIYSEDTMEDSIPVITSWQLNERMYGELQGLNKQETAERYGKELVHDWRRSFDVPPPNGESLEMCSKRAVSYFREHIEPHLHSGKNVLVVAHGNSLRSIIMYLDKLSPQEVISLELSTGVPLLYMIRSLVGPTELGVYAYSDNLAVYRQELDGISN